MYGPPLFGPTFSAWVGVGGGGGDISNEGDGPLGNVVDVSIPLGVSVGYRFNPIVRGNIFFEGVPLVMDDRACFSGNSCGGADYRLGLDIHLHLAPLRHVDPWLGIGFGYEWLRFDATGCDISGFCFGERFRYSGWIFPRISAGLDLAASPFSSFGPYIAYTAGQYSNVNTDTAGSMTIHDRAYHGWLEIGIRGNLNL